MSAQKRSKTPKVIVAPDREPYLIGYARVSMNDQTPQLQIDALLAHGVPQDRIYFDQKSGSGVKRPEFDAMMLDARAGDVIVVWKLDRLGRSTRQVLNTFFELEEKGAKVRVLTQPLLDTTNPMGRFFVAVMAAFAEMEKDIIGERTKAGLAAARERGRVGGRTSKHSDEDVLNVARQGTAKAAKRLGMTKGGFIKRLHAARARAAAKQQESADAEPEV
jgi:DNA invertase Pin-like site-specific DNA recombinase